MPDLKQRHFLLFILLLFLFPLYTISQSAYSISGTIEGCYRDEIKLSKVYGKEVIMTDSVFLSDNCEFHYDLPDSLYKGMLRVSIGNENIDLIINKENIAFETNIRNLTKIKISSSEENKQYYFFLSKALALDDSIKYYTLIGRTIYEKDPTSGELKSLAKKISGFESAKLKLADSLISKHPDLFSTKIIKASLPPDFKAYMKKKDAAPYPSEAVFLQEHFFDNIDFSDSNLLHTEIIFDKIGEYFQYFADPPSVDSYKKAIDFILVRTSANKNVNEYVMNTLIKTFDHSEWEEVYAYAAQKYLSQNSCSDESVAKKLQKKLTTITSLKPGCKAPSIKSFDLNGKELISDSIKSKYMVVVFWASWCEYCEKAIPDLKNSYSSYKNKNLEIFAVSLDSIKQNWEDASKRYNIPWINTCDLKGFKSKTIDNYNIWQTPTFFLLDADNKIIAKPVNTTILKEELGKLKWE
jgi:thiol-disulfide isomerase/thioredoxin